LCIKNQPGHLLHQRKTESALLLFFMRSRISS
jgi:hypothetical protein